MNSPITPHEATEEGRAFLQHRVSVAGLAGLAIGMAFFTMRTVEALVAGIPAVFVDPSYWLHLAAASCLSAMWLVCRTGKRSIGFVRAAETFGILGAAVCYSLMGSYIPPWLMPHQIITLAMMTMLIARSIYVPSTTRATLILTLTAGVPIMVATFFLYVDVDVSGWEHIGELGRSATGLDIAIGFTMTNALWWAAVVALSTAASTVIYGLRRNVRTARKLGQYELVEQIGEGGMGLVFRAEHAMLRRPTAVKLLPTDKVGELSLARFEKEVQLTARLTHPNTVTIFDYGRTPEGVFYYAMELLDGATLQTVVETCGPLSAGRVVRIVDQVARALAEAHDVGLIHRDIKPANIMLVRQGGEFDVAKVLDFGLVKELEGDATTSLTQANSVMGTPQYLSPEAITDSSSVDARSDIYALGAVAYYLLAGEHVFSGNGIVEVCSKHLYEEPPPLSDHVDSIPPELASLVIKCLSKDKEERPQSAAEFAAAIRDCAGVEPWTAEDAKAWWSEHGDTLATKFTPAMRTPSCSSR